MSSRALKVLHRIRALVNVGRYSFGSHAWRHMMEEGFDKEHCIGAILDGRVVDDDPRRSTCVISGRFHVSAQTLCRLHVVCDYSEYERVGIVTAFIPRPLQTDGKRRCARGRLS